VKKHYIVASRASALAMTQSRSIVTALKQIYPDVEIVIKNITTTGDQDTSTALWKLEGTGFFTSQIEAALLSKEADLAVHSFKDLPTRIAKGLKIAAMCRRQYVEDVLVAKKPARSLSDVPHGATIGTSSLRRRAQLKHIRADLKMITIRGNVETRLKKVETGEVDAVIMARAGLERLGLADRITQIFDPTEFVPAPAQGTLAVQTRDDDPDTIQLVAAIDEHYSGITASAERKVLAIMEGGCHAPIGAYAKIDGQIMHLIAFVSDLEGRHYIKRAIQGAAEKWQSLAEQLAAELLAAGGKEILKELEKLESK
jgi:hydroxymethylbilane synthase